MLETLIRRAADQCREYGLKHFIFSWHGGEPLLAGMEFFEYAVELQRRMMPEIQVSNSIQTNGMLLTREWVRLFKSLDYHMSLSLDGPEYVHDAYRVWPTGKGTYRELAQRIGVLRDERYPIRILAVVSPRSLDVGGKSVYELFRSLGCVWMDFLYPIRNVMDSTFSEDVSAKDLGEFLVEVFDAWFAEGNPDVYVRSLHDWCVQLMGGHAEMCHSRVDCSYVVTVNTDGSVHICDDLIPYADSKLGHISRDALVDIDKHESLRRLSKKSVLFSGECSRCEFFPVCTGGCTLFRAKHLNDFSGRNVYCETQKLVITHIRDVLCGEIGALLEQRLSA